MFPIYYIAVILITDSVSNVNPVETLPEAQKLKETGAHIYTVGVGSFDTHELRSIASNPDAENTFVFSDFNALADLPRQLVTATCQSKHLYWKRKYITNTYSKTKCS